MDREDELMHYGVVGMKWGIRRYQNKDGTLTDAGRKRSARAAKRQQRNSIKKSRSVAAKNRSLLSDKDLDKRIKRLEKEKRLKELTAAEVHPGRTYAKEVLDRYGNQAAKAVVATATAIVIRKYMSG